MADLTPAFRFLSPPLLATAFTGCTTTEQSGSEAPDDGSATVSCPCDALGVYLKVEVLDVTGTNVSLAVQEVVHGDTPFAVGSTIEATWDGSLPCYTGTATVEVGSIALATYYDSTCERARQEESEVDDASECFTAESSGFEIALTPWADEIVFAETSLGTITVPSSELSSLWDNASCRTEYGDWSSLLESAP